MRQKGEIENDKQKHEMPKCPLLAHLLHRHTLGITESYGKKKRKEEVGSFNFSIPPALQESIKEWQVSRRTAFQMFCDLYQTNFCGNIFFHLKKRTRLSEKTTTE